MVSYQNKKYTFILFHNIKSKEVIAFKIIIKNLKSHADTKIIFIRQNECEKVYSRVGI